MKKAHVFNYSQVIKTDRMKSIQNFTKNSSLPIAKVIEISLSEENPGGVIDQYKTGKINTAEFRSEMNNLIKNAGGNILANEVFEDSWNSMCKVEQKDLKELYDSQQKHNNFHVHIIGRTNELQHTFIQQEIQKAAPHTPGISYTLSYEIHTSDVAALKQHAETILKAQDYDPEWHMDAQQQDYEQNALKILGKFYSDIIPE